MKIKVTAVTFLMFIVGAAYAAIPASSFVGSDATENFCESGGICAVVCKNNKDIKVSFSDFVDVKSSSNISRRILERYGSSATEQLRQATLRLVEASPEFATEFDVAMDDVNAMKFVSSINVNHLSEGCGFKRIAYFSHEQKNFLVEKDLYSRMSATDQAGLKARLALERVSDKNQKGNQDLVQRLFYTNAEDWENSRHGLQPSTKTERLEVLRSLINSVDSQNAARID